MPEKKLLAQFVKRSVVLFLFLSTLCAVVFLWIIPQHYFSFVPIIFLYFFILNILTFRFLVRVHNLSTQKFANQFMLITALKFFGSLIFAILFILFSSSHTIPFLVIFITLYFSTLIQGVRNFLKVLNQRNPK